MYRRWCYLRINVLFWLKAHTVPATMPVIGPVLSCFSGRRPQAHENACNAYTALAHGPKESYRD